MHAFAFVLDLGLALYGFFGFGPESGVVADGDVAAGGEGEGAVDDHFFSGGFAEGFGPGEFAGVAFHFELGGVSVSWGSLDRDREEEVGRGDERSYGIYSCKT